MRGNLKNILIPILVLFAAWFIIQQGSILSPIRNLFRPKSIQVSETPLLVKNIREIAQLMTIEYFDEVVVDSSRKGAFLPIPPFIMPGRQSLVIVAKGRLLAGLDLQRLDSSHISGTRDSIVVRLPPAQILEVEMNPSDVETFSEKGQWSQEAVAALTVKAKTLMLQHAAAQGVLIRANEKAKQLVEQLLVNAGFKKVIVAFP